MAAAANIYANCLKQAFAAQIALTTDTLKMALLGTGYTPSLTADTHWSDINSHEIPGTGGYTTGGQTLTAVTLTLTAANSWGQAWTATTSYPYGYIIRPGTGNGFLYRQVTAGAGVTGSSSPAFPTVTGDVVADGTATWACLGDAVLVFSSAAVSWVSLTASNIAYAAIYDANSGTPSVEPLIVLETFAAAQSPSAATFQVVPDTNLGWFAFSPPA